MRTLGCLILVACTAATQVVPAPKRMDVGYTVCSGTGIRCDVADFQPQVEAFVAALRRLGADRIERTETPGDEVLVFERGTVGGPENYRIVIRDRTVIATAEASVGVARAAATLLQLARVSRGRVAWPDVEVDDAPDLPFRCFMIDMGRNPHGPDVLQQIVDAAWLYKVNYLHLHLCDDQLFSWPSKAFPKLYSERAGWTWDDFVQLEDYARSRGVAIIPEVDVPGHSTILRRKYPEVFGKTPTDLASRPASQRGMERLIAELLSVFKSTPYFHIGGDEAYGVPADTQRDFINRLNRFIRSQKRRTLVWEGPHLGEGDNKVDTSVIHMNWRTINFPAQEMLDAGYEVVNAAWDPLYIVDHYPRTMFTAVSVERCYGWDLRRFAHVNHGMPTFARPHRTGSSEGILGFCMPWWEGREKNMMPLCVPRLAAVASAAWNRDGERDFSGFEQRQQTLIPLLETIADMEFPVMPVADPETQKDNLAFNATVTPSAGASQPVFGPQRLTNGIAERFDHFLGFPTQPEPLEIVIDLGAVKQVGRVIVHETAVGKSHEVYALSVSSDGQDYAEVGRAAEGSRGEQTFVEHAFEARPVRFIRILTSGCHGLTFPSFSRLTEVMAFAE